MSVNRYTGAGEALQLLSQPCRDQPRPVREVEQGPIPATLAGVKTGSKKTQSRPRPFHLYD